MVKNNFNFLRFLFALFVVISHAYPLSGSDETQQWIYKITNNQIALAQIGLSGFFIISGYFIYQSLERSQKLTDYFKKRFLRIFPALFFVLLASVLLSPFVYEGNLAFFHNKEVYTYLPNNLTLYGFQSGIEGVFDSNPYHAINGSLWTIKYEFTLYILVAMFFFIKNKKEIKVILLSVVFGGMLYLYNCCLDRFGESSLLGFLGIHVLNLGTFFIAGSLLAALKFENLKYKLILLFITALILIIALYFKSYDPLKHIFLPIFILLSGFVPVNFIKDSDKFGDPSYGIYIYSFPVQQCLVYFFNLHTFTLIIGSVCISVALGYLSWHLIEKKALQYKKLEFGINSRLI